MQQPPNQEYPQQQWQQPNTSWGSTPQWQQYEPLAAQYPQQMPSPQQQTYYGQLQSYYPPPSQQQWNPQQPQFFPPQYQPPIQRPKRNRVGLWVSGGIICVVLAVLVVVGSVLIGYRYFTSTQYPTLHTEYNGTITNSIISASPIATVQMALIITSNDNQGHISGRIGIVLAPKGGDPFIGTLGVDGTITFTATPFFLGVFTIFTGKVNSDSSISGTASNSTDPSETWKLFPVKGH
jgi:hypothetical protein